MEITNELLAAYAKGNVSEEELLAVRGHLAKNPADMQTVFEALDVYQDLEEIVCPKRKDNIESPGHDDFATVHQRLSNFTKEIKERSRSTMFAIAADNTIDNLCDIRCEGYALRKLGIEISDEQLEKESRDHEWLTDKGTRLMDIGKLCELHGAAVTRQLETSLDEVLEAINKKKIVIVSVDEGELVGDFECEQIEDKTIGKCPDHVVIVTGFNEEKLEIEIIDPNTPQFSDTYPLDRFMDAWDDSSYYMVTVN